VSAAVEARIHSLPEALARLASPYAAEELATLTGEGVLVVDLPAGDPPALAGRAGARVSEALRRLACPTIAIVSPESGRSVGDLARAFDLRIESADALARLVEPIHRYPQASLALVQLLRHNEALDVHEGLIAESLVYSTLQSGEEFARWREGRVARPRPEPERPVLRVSRTGVALDLVFDHPERHNAFGVSLRDALVEALQLAVSDESIEEIVLHANGPSFCSGGDLDEFGSLPDPATAHAVRSTRNPARLLARVAERTRAVVHGACIGAGVELPAFVAHVTARPDAFFQLPEVRMGLVPGAGGTVSLPRRIGRQRTALLAITGERVDVATALDWGLVDAVA
jgi:hypothetical protein